MWRFQRGNPGTWIWWSSSNMWWRSGNICMTWERDGETEGEGMNREPDKDEPWKGREGKCPWQTVRIWKEENPGRRGRRWRRHSNKSTSHSVVNVNSSWDLPTLGRSKLCQKVQMNLKITLYLSKTKPTKLLLVHRNYLKKLMNFLCWIPASSSFIQLIAFDDVILTLSSSLLGFWFSPLEWVAPFPF